MQKGCESCTVIEKAMLQTQEVLCMMKKRCLLLCLLLLLSGCTQQNVEKMPEEPPVTVGESTPGGADAGK